MSVLTLIRHGQVAQFQKSSDRLSSTGELQACKLAAFWLNTGIRFDETYTGSLVRHVLTEQIVAEHSGTAGSAWPAAQPLAGFDEYDAAGVLARLVPAIAERDQSFARLLDTSEAARDTPDQNRAFQRMFEVAMRTWALGKVAVNGVEPWPAFRARVREALQRIMTGDGNRRIAVFTSGGPIGLSVQTAMQAPDRMFLEVNWRVRNCSLTEFVFSGDRFTLDSFNAVPHLNDTALWTYR